MAYGDDTWILPPQTLFTLKARHIWCPRSPNKRCLTLNTRSWRNKSHRNLIILASEIWPIGKDVHSNLLYTCLKTLRRSRIAHVNYVKFITSNPKLCRRLSKTRFLVCLPKLIIRIKQTIIHAKLDMGSFLSIFVGPVRCQWWIDTGVFALDLPQIFNTPTDKSQPNLRVSKEKNWDLLWKVLQNFFGKSLPEFRPQVSFRILWGPCWDPHDWYMITYVWLIYISSLYIFGINVGKCT